MESKQPFGRILVATDFSESSRQALELGLQLAQQFGSELTLMHSWDPPNYSYAAGLYLPLDVITPIERAAAAHLEEATAQLRQRFPAAKSLLCEGAPWERVLDAAARVNADLIVMGTHGRSGLERVLLGSVAERVVRMARIPVLTVRGVPE